MPIWRLFQSMDTGRTGPSGRPAIQRAAEGIRSASDSVNRPNSAETIVRERAKTGNPVIFITVQVSKNDFGTSFEWSPNP